MGRPTTEVLIENMEDLWEVERGLRSADDVRRFSTHDALVDTGATMLALPKKLIAMLDLKKMGHIQATIANGKSNLDVYRLVNLTVQGRSCPLDVVEVADDCLVLIGQIPLERLDFVVDCQARKLIPNPAHNALHTVEVM